MAAMDMVRGGQTVGLFESRASRIVDRLDLEC